MCESQDRILVYVNESKYNEEVLNTRLNKLAATAQERTFIKNVIKHI